MPTFSFRNTSTGTVTQLTGSTPFDLSGLLPDGTYAVRALSEEAPIPLTVSTAGPTPNPPSTVTGLTVTPGSEQNTLSWSAPAPGSSAITDYTVQVNSGSGFSTVSDGVSTATGFVHSGLTNDVSYTYRVAAANTVGTGPFSASVSGTPSAPVTSTAAESDAQGHWLFGTDNPADSDLITGQSLSANGAAPARSNGYLSIQGQGNGLLTHVADTANITLCMVLRRPAGAEQAILGGVMDNNSGPQAGWSPFTRNPNGIFMRNKGGSELVELDTNAPTDSFYFIAMSLSAGGAHVYFRGTAGANIVDTGTTSRGTVRALNVALGDVHFNTPNLPGAFDCAELILWNSSKTQAEIEQVFLRSRDRLATRGLNMIAPAA